MRSLPLKQGMGTWWDSFVSCGDYQINVFVPGNARRCRGQREEGNC